MAGEESRSSSYQHQVVRVASHSVVPAGHKLCAALSATAEDLAELEALFAELEEKISGNGIPASPSAFVHKQVAAIRDALRQYPIGGPVALRRATRAMAADIRLDEDEIRHAAQAGDPPRSPPPVPHCRRPGIRPPKSRARLRSSAKQASCSSISAQRFQMRSPLPEQDA